MDISQSNQSVSTLNPEFCQQIIQNLENAKKTKAAEELRKKETTQIIENIINGQKQQVENLRKKCSQLKDEVAEYDEMLEETEKKLQKSKQQLKESEEHSDKLQKRLNMFETLFDEEKYKNQKLSEDNKKMEKELLELMQKKEEWNDEISIIQQIDNSKIEEANDEISKCVGILESQGIKVNDLEKKLKDKDEEIQKYKQRILQANRALKEKEEFLISEKNEMKKDFDGPTEDEITQLTMARSFSMGDLLDITGKYFNRLSPKQLVRAKNSIICFVEQQAQAKF